jgi:hypothetical protein
MSASGGYRHTIRPAGTGFVVACGPPREWKGVIFLSLWLVGWSIGGFAIATEAFDPRDRSVLTAVMAIAWLGVTLFSLLVLAWQVSGTEELHFSGRSLTHRWRAAGIGQTRAYAIERIGRFRACDYVEPHFEGQHLMMPPDLWKPHGVVVFDYEGRTVHVAAGMRDADARRIVAEVGRRLPRLVDG